VDRSWKSSDANVVKNLHFLISFCRQAIHLGGLPALCYIVMRTQDPHSMQR